MSDPSDADRSIPTLTVSTANESRESFLAGAGGDADFREGLALAPVLVVPGPGHAGYEAPVFPQGTLEVLQFLQEGLPDGVRVEIAVEDEAYEELTLHAAAIILPTVLLQAWAGAIALNILSNYIYDLLKDAKARREARVRARVLVETPTRTLSIDYDGPAEQFSELTRLAFDREVPEAERERPVEGRLAAETVQALPGDVRKALPTSGLPRPAESSRGADPVAGGSSEARVDDRAPDSRDE